MWQATLNRPISAILFFWRAPFRARDYVSLLRLQAEFQSTVLCCTENLLIPIQHFIVALSVSIKWDDKARGRGCCSPAKYLNWLLTVIVTKRECQEMSVQLREVLKVFQGCHNLNRNTKQPAVTSPAVQFRPVPLTKRMLVRVGQVNRFNRQ